MQINTTNKVKYPVEIEVTEKYKITADKFGWNIHTRNRNKEGELTTWSQEYYVPSCISCLSTLAGLLRRNMSATNWVEFIHNCKEIQSIIVNTAKIIKMLDSEKATLTVEEIKDILKENK